MKTEIIKSKKVGIVFSYILIACNTLSNIILVPFYLKFLGIDGYGFYQMIYSVASYIMILDFGIGTTMVRFITEHRTKKDNIKEQNFAAHCLIIVIILSITIVVVGIILSNFLGNIYSILTEEKVELGKKLFLLMLSVLVMTLFEHYFEGITMAYGLYSLTKVFGIFKILTKSIVVLIFLHNGIGVTSLFLVDFISQSIIIVIYCILIFAVMHYKIRLHYFDKSILISVGSFMMAIMLQSIVAYINNTTDKTILGIMIGENASGLYGLSMTFITMFNMAPTSILTIFLPKATKMIVSGSSMKEQSDIAGKIGRYQMIVCGGIISAFIVFGKDFISLWAKIDPKEVWLIALIIMIPNSVPLIQNYCLNVLDALNKRLFRSIVLLGLSVLNIFLTIILIKLMGIMGAPIATAIAYIIGHWIVINIYYKKNIGLDVKSIWKNITNRLLPVIVIITAVCYSINYVIPVVTWPGLIIKAILWCIAYIVSIYFVGLRKSEKAYISNLFKRVFAK